MGLPPSKLNRLPEGLLSFFDIKSMGQYPQELSQQLQANMDLFRFYADQAAEEGIAVVSPFAAVSTNAGASALSSARWAAGGLTDFSEPILGTSTVVPANEIWIVLEASVKWSFSATAGQEFAATLMSTNPGAGPIMGQVLCEVPGTGFTTSNAGFIREGMCAMSEPQILLPQSVLRIYHFGALVPAGQVDLRVYVRIRRLRR